MTEPCDIVLKLVGGEEPGDRYTFARIVQHGDHPVAILAARTKPDPKGEKPGQVFVHDDDRAGGDCSKREVGLYVGCRDMVLIPGRNLPHVEEWYVLRDGRVHDSDAAHAEAANNEPVTAEAPGGLERIIQQVEAGDAADATAETNAGQTAACLGKPPIIIDEQPEAGIDSSGGS